MLRKLITLAAAAAMLAGCRTQKQTSQQTVVRQTATAARHSTCHDTLTHTVALQLDSPVVTITAPGKPTITLRAAKAVVGARQQAGHHTLEADTLTKSRSTHTEATQQQVTVPLTPLEALTPAQGIPWAFIALIITTVAIFILLKKRFNIFSRTK